LKANLNWHNVFAVQATLLPLCPRFGLCIQIHWMLVADKSITLALTGTGDVLEPEGGIMAIGSGGNYALAAARALADGNHSAEEIARRAMEIAAEICVYTNGSIIVECLESSS
jgi:ATP-dependent HslUV protease subunit HslV